MSEEHAQQLAAVHAKAAKTKREKLSHKEKSFAKEFVANRGNGTQAVLATYDTDDEKSASVIAHQNLGKVKVRQEIEAIMSKNGIELDEIMSLHARNARQDKHLPTSQKAIGDFYDILGVKPTQSNDGSVKIAFIIEQ